MTTATAFNPGLLPSSAPRSARAVFAVLRHLRLGMLDVQLPDGGQLRFGSPQIGQPQANIRLLNWKLCSAVLRSGDIGFAESHIAGDWTTADLAALLRLMLANRDAIASMIYGSWWGRLLHRARHLLNRNSRAGSRRNIHAHYDLGNEFYSLWLDGTMNYSSAWFDGNLSQAMATAQHAKVRRALTQCQVGAGSRVLEIGCGWGALAECAAAELGANVVGVTLSREQLEFAQRRVTASGLGARCELRLQDYRDIADGPFDAIASIEMFEAVGREYWGEYFAMIARQLKPSGRACIQSITIRDDLFERYVSGTDFIQQYIFPGGLLPSREVFRAEAHRAGLVVVDELAFGPDYAETLRRWRAAFLRQDTQVRNLGFDTGFIRIWEFYLAYCEAAFDAGSTDVVQFTLAHA